MEDENTGLNEATKNKMGTKTFIKNPIKGEIPDMAWLHKVEHEVLNTRDKLEESLKA